jgi:hypothetical protein
MHGSPYFRRTLRDRLIDRCLLIGTAIALSTALALVIIPAVVAFVQRMPA